jgi:ligand-binding sensor domain-containing protein
MESYPGQSFTKGDGLTSDVVWGELIDHEGSIWLATNSGLDHLRKTSLHKVALPPAQEHQFGIAAREAGAVWTGSESLDLTHVAADGKITGFPKIGSIASVRRDRSGTLWVGAKGDAGLWRSTPTRFSRVHYLKENEQPVISLAKDRDNGLWILLRQYSVLRLDHGVWTKQNKS